MKDTNQINELLADFPVRVEIPVAWGDMDAMGHVNNVVYFRYFETARITAFSELGLGAIEQADDVGKIFCLVEAPDAEAANAVHREAHGMVADEIYSVSEFA